MNTTPFHALLIPAGEQPLNGQWADLQERLLPGAFGLALSGGSGHRLCCAVEDAGFLIHPSIFLWTGTRLEAAVMFQKPYLGRPVGSILSSGAGALNIAANRIEYEQGGNLASNPSLRTHINGGNGGHVIASEKERRVVIPDPGGRWPANLILTHLSDCAPDACAPGCPVAALDGVQTSKTGNRRIKERVQDKLGVTTFTHSKNAPEYTDGGGAARYFTRLDWAEEDGRLSDGLHPVSLYRWLAALLLPPEAYAPRRLLAPCAPPALLRGAALAGWECVETD